MQKTPKQITFSLFMLCVFIFGVVTLYPRLEEVILVLASGYLEFSTKLVVTIFVYLLFIVVQVLFLVSAIQIYRSNNFKLLSGLLWASIPHFSLFGFITYVFVFGPYLILTAGLTFEPAKLFMDLEFELFSVQYLLTFANEYQGVLQLGLNVVPIILLWVLKKWD